MAANSSFQAWKRKALSNIFSVPMTKLLHKTNHIPVDVYRKDMMNEGKFLQCKLEWKLNIVV